MRVGVPKEIKNHEYRVGLTPPSVDELVAAGHEVDVETQAGSGIDFEDQDYVDAGATILPTAICAALTPETPPPRIATFAGATPGTPPSKTPRPPCSFSR